MTDAFITQCPHCQSSFRIKLSQLDATQETVRCGACLQEYNAASQFNNNSIKQATPQHIAQHNPAIILLSAQTAKALPAPAPTPGVISQLSMIDNVIALSNLDASDLEYEQDRLDWELHYPQHTTEQPVAQTSASVLNSPAQPPVNPAASPELLLENSTTSVIDVLETHAVPVPMPPLTTAEGSSPEAVQPQPEPGSAAQSAPDHFAYFSDEPIRLDWQPKPKKSWQPWHMWSLLNVVAVLLLLSQYTYHNFTELARQDSTRPLLAAICPLFGCELPAKVDIEQIKSSNLVIRSHPEFKGALQVDAIIYNRAPFSQPFPLLELTFSDAQGERLMSRKFKAEEYLSGELAGQNNMPQQVPIHIALEILAPSSETISYSLKFVSPD